MRHAMLTNKSLGSIFLSTTEKISPTIIPTLILRSSNIVTSVVAFEHIVSL